MAILVVCADEGGLPQLPDDVRVVEYGESPLLLEELGTASAIVAVSTGLDERACERLATLIARGNRRVIEVRVDRWDGEAHSPLSAACTGVVFGFGAAGIQAAVQYLRETAEPAV